MDKTWIPTVAGVLDIVTGGLAIVAVGLFGLAIFVLNTVPDIDPTDAGIVIAKTVLVSLGTTFLVIALLAIFGANFKALYISFEIRSGRYKYNRGIYVGILGANFFCQFDSGHIRHVYIQQY